MSTLTRREALVVAALAGVAAAPQPRKSVVWVWLAGGPSQVETFRPTADSVTGRLPTSVPGVRLGGTFPELAKRAGRFAVVREFGHTLACHDRATHLMMTGREADADRPTTAPALPGRHLRLTTGDLTGRMAAAVAACEAGPAIVTVPFGDWDMHADIAGGMRRLGPELDAGLAAFLDAVADRGLTNDVLLVVTGEFGRSPRLNRHGGRDHWPTETPLLLAGGGVGHGVIDGPRDPAGLLALASG